MGNIGLPLGIGITSGKMLKLKDELNRVLGKSVLSNNLNIPPIRDNYNSETSSINIPLDSISPTKLSHNHSSTNQLLHNLAGL